MEFKQIKFINIESLENLKTIDSDEEITSFLKNYNLNISEVFDLNDSVYTVEEISVQFIDQKIEILVYSKFYDLKENIPTL